MIALLLDGVLVAVGVEALALAAYHRRTGRGIGLRAASANLAAGFFLVLAARLATTRGMDFATAGVAAALGAALVAHVVDLAGRWRG